ncbi:MAG TPA: succinylglutamate desuccinylase/aspartoacylase family protein [Pyrinomonadaceae bacterium]|nr:succinylglutamate desuccinylase/aspartoacylase family protein [Pyrinomonadaceae bacterium]
MSTRTLTRTGKVASPQKGSTAQTRATPTAAPNRALEIQQLVGNRAFGQLVQTKLKISPAPVSPVVQRSPISDDIQKVWNATPTIEALLGRLGQADVQGAQKDADIDAKITTLLAGRADDLWLAQRIRQGRLNEAPRRRPIEAHFIQGKTSRRALVIAGVHGSERQGIDVARMLLSDLSKTQPLYTVILVPSLFPDNAATGTREGATQTNRNFPDPSKDLAAATPAGRRRTPKDALKQEILPENIMLLQLMERFHPERIISIHGTRYGGAGGVFYDPVQPTPRQIAQMHSFARTLAYIQVPFWMQFTSMGQQQLQQAEARNFTRLLQNFQDRDQASALTAAAQIDAATKSITGRESRSMLREDEKTIDPTEKGNRAAHPSVAGNVGSSGNLDIAHFSGKDKPGISLGKYASERGISIFTVEPPLNLRMAAYPTKADADVDAAERRIELQAYADAVRTVLLGP